MGQPLFEKEIAYLNTYIISLSLTHTHTHTLSYGDLDLFLYQMSLKHLFIWHRSSLCRDYTLHMVLWMWCMCD